MGLDDDRYAIPPEAIRVFLGFPRPELDEKAFFAQLGDTFMPGTPYMLQPLGLAAYLPGVLSNTTSGFPREFALICYPSVNVWNTAMNLTLRGRVYNQTHGGVYAMPPSGAAFPVYIDSLPPAATDPFYLMPGSLDWQRGVTRVAVAGKAEPKQAEPAFRTALRGQLKSSREKLGSMDVDQVIVTTRDAFAVLWFHSRSGAALDLSFLSAIIATPTLLENRRILCPDEPPKLQITQSSAFNFIFLREPRYFLK